jgi:predicted transcriptional regulator
MAGERYRLLRQLHSRPEKSINAVAQALHRQYRRVHEDVTALESAGLIERTDGQVRTAADKLSAAIVL